MLKNILAIARKELQVLFRDRGTLVVLFLLPLLFSSFVGSVNVAAQRAEGGGGEEEEALFSVVVTNLDVGEYGTQIVEALSEIDVLETRSVGDMDEADRLVGDGEVIAAILIPADFSAKVDAYESVDIQVILDPINEKFASAVTGIVRNVAAMINLQGEVKYGIRMVIAETSAFDEAPPEMMRAIEAQSFGALMTQLGELESNAQISVESEDVVGEEVDTSWNPFNYFVPGFTVMFAFFLTTIVGSTMHTEKDNGSLRRLLAAPIQRGSIIAGKMLAYMLVICLQVALMFAIGHGFFDMPLGNIPGLALMTVALSLTSTSLGMLVAAVSTSRKQADDLGTVLALVLAALGGVMAPLFRQAGFVGILSKMTPHAHAIMGYLDVINEGAELVSVLPRVGILAGFGVVFFLVAVWRFKWE